jgi:hypothetical protein
MHVAKTAEPARPILYQASIEADALAAERIGAVLEEAPDPSPVAVGLFDRGMGRAEVFAHFEEAPRRDALLTLIEQAALGTPLGLSASRRGQTKIG